jgi:hypothetical protein
MKSQKQTRTAFSRRAFLRRAAATTGLASAAFYLPRKVRSATRSPVLWMHVQADGGWDQCLSCDPKPALRSGATAAEKQVVSAGNIPYMAFADFPASPSASGSFFTNHASRLLVFNGVDTTTNNHSTGTMYSSTGSLTPGYPCFSAQVAGVFGQGQPLAFIDAGGMDFTAQLIAPSRLNEDNLSLLQLLTNPNQVDPSSTGTFMKPDTVSLIEAAHLARLNRQLASARLPGVQQAQSGLLNVRQGQGILRSLTVPTSGDGALARVVIDAFQKGLTSAYNHMYSHFDSHSNNEPDQRTALKALLEGVDQIVTLSEAANVPTVIVMTSDFGRTPQYGTQNGTDHWPISSIMVLVNKPAQAIVPLPVNRVIGATDDKLMPMKVDPSTLLLDSGGIVLGPIHVYRALRRAAGIDGADALARFPLSSTDDLNLG